MRKENTFFQNTSESKQDKNVKILEFDGYIIWNHHEKRIQVSTNMPVLVQ